LAGTAADYQIIADRINLVIDEIETVIIGKREVITLAMAAIMSNGHILIEDAPGLGKTTLAKSIAKVLGCTFKRIQFTPDLLPADITGTSIFNQKTGEFQFREGPIFAQVILADEINRATPKTQSSLLECMEEYQATIDGTTYPMQRPFYVIATDNTLGYSGTYPLPEGQLDRFMMRLDIGYPQKSQEAQILDSQTSEHPVNLLHPLLNPEEVLSLQGAMQSIHLETSLRDYIVDITTATRSHPAVALGASPRGSIALSHASRALAGISGRDFVIPDDIKTLAVPVLAHRLVLKPDAKIKHNSSADIIKEILAKVAVPC
jgi:MoxR-like ATPase